MHRRVRKRIRWVVIISTAVVSGIFITREVMFNARLTASYDKPADRHEAWVQDLDHFQHNYFRVSKSFPKDSIEHADRIIDSLRENIDAFSDGRIQLLISRCVSMAKDSHTRVFFGNFRRIPLRLFLFDDGLYVVRAQRGYEKFLGLKVIGIAGKTVEELVSMVDQYMPGNRSWPALIFLKAQESLLQLIQSAINFVSVPTPLRNISRHRKQTTKRMSTLRGEISHP
jgi:hypothetical protein